MSTRRKHAKGDRDHEKQQLLVMHFVVTWFFSAPVAASTSFSVEFRFLFHTQKEQDRKKSNTSCEL